MAKKLLKPPKSIIRRFPEVETCVDSTKGVEVNVSQKDCAKSAPGDPTKCAMAKALMREYQADGAVIGLAFSYVIIGKTATRFMTPPTVGREITSFDRNADFAPGSYHLAAVTPSQRRGRKQQRHRTKEHVRSQVVHKQTVRVRHLREDD